MDLNLRALRILRNMPLFNVISDIDNQAFNGLVVSQGEALFGWYDNKGAGRVAVTDRSIYLGGNPNWQRIQLSQIASLEITESKVDADYLRVRLVDGAVLTVPWRGSSHGRKEVFELARFLRLLTGIGLTISDSANAANMEVLRETLAKIDHRKGRP